MLKKYNRNFHFQDSLEEEKKRFVNRINQALFKSIEDERIFKMICYQLGISADDRIREFSSNNFVKYGPGTYIPPLRSLTNDNFIETQKIIILLYEHFHDDSELLNNISVLVEEALSKATLDLEVRWKDGMFYPSGAKFLDEKLIEDSFDWLDDYPNEKHDFSNAVSNYADKKWPDVIGDCYLVFEGLARNILKNKRTLYNNREALLEKIKLSSVWSKFLNNYINYANDSKRHASSNRHSVKPIEAESFLYLTGLMVLLVIESV